MQATVLRANRDGCCSPRKTDRSSLGRATDRVEATRQKPPFGRARNLAGRTIRGMPLHGIPNTTSDDRRPTNGNCKRKPRRLTKDP
jgi:hypothetical protein